MTVQQLVDGAPDFLPEERSQTAPPKSTFQELPVDVRRIEALGADACPWLDRYIAFSERWSPRSYDGFHVACAIWLLCVIAARRVVLNLGGRRYTNLYFALCARSSLYAKTTAVKVALEFLGTLGLSSFLAPDESTPQAFIRAMSLHVPKGYSDMDEVNRTQIHMQLAFAAQKGWFYEEFGQKIASMMRDSGVMTDFRGLLRRLDDCPQTYRYEAISRDPDVVIRPYLALLANLTPADLGRYAKRGAALWSDGFFARFAFIVPPTDLPLSLARFPEGEREVPTALMQPLLEWHQRLGIPKVTIREVTGEAGKAGGAFDVSYAYVPEQHCILAPGVREAFYVYHDALLTLVSSSDQYDLDGNYARFAEKALRVAMLLASLSNEGRIELRHWARAQQIAEIGRA
ncbi:MAG: DUF3987 domain-containing protein, partial [Oscillochloris sp.]|nr:DUF3987 domain-containing protein [Oscillochloris sp.]